MIFGDKYIWTNHAYMKMRHYRLTEARIKRVIRHPVRTEEGVIENAIACMQPAEGKRYSEIWVMYLVAESKVSARGGSALGGKNEKFKVQDRKIKIITAWRYPGRAPERDPVPESILREIKNIL